jgi:transcriptional regulator with XRE-family HTH domain
VARPIQAGAIAMGNAVNSDRYKAFIGLLIAARKDAGLSQAEVAERLGLPQPFVSKYENRVRRLDVSEFIDVAEALDTDPIALLRKLL